MKNVSYTWTNHVSVSCALMRRMVELVDWAGKREAGLTAMHAFQQECRAAGSLPDDMRIEKGNAMIMEPCMYNYS